MNLRAKHNQLRFRISGDELDKLLSGKSLHEDIFIPSAQHLKIEIRINKNADQILNVNFQDSLLCLSVSPDALQTLTSEDEIINELPVHSNQLLKVNLQVDLRQRN